MKLENIATAVHVCVMYQGAHDNGQSLITDTNFLYIISGSLLWETAPPGHRAWKQLLRHIK